MAERINLLIQLHDAFSVTARKIRGEVQGLDKAINKELNGSLSILRNRFAQLGAAFGAVKLSQLGQDAEETANRFRAVFGPEAQRMAGVIDDIADSIGRSRQELQKTTSTFQTFFVGMGFGAREAADLSEQLTRVSLDFASFNNLSDEEAAQRFISALSGSAEVLDRFGVNLRVAALDQQLLNSGLGKTAKDATEAEKALARVSIITESLGRQGALGDAERTADSFANQLKRVQGEALDAAAAIGTELNIVLLPYLKRLGELLRAGAEWVRQNRDTVRSLIDTAIQIGKVVLAFQGLRIALGVVRILGAMGPALLNVTSSVGALLGRQRLLNDSLKDASGKMRDFLKSIGPALISAGLGLLIAKVLELKTALDELDAAQRQLTESRNNRQFAEGVLGQVRGLEAAARSGLQQAQLTLDFVRGGNGQFDDLAERLKAITEFRQTPTLREAVRLMDEFGLSVEKLLALTDSSSVQGEIVQLVRSRTAAAGQARAQAIAEREVADELDRQVDALEKLARETKTLAQQFDQTEAVGRAALDRNRSEIRDLEATAQAIGAEISQFETLGAQFRKALFEGGSFDNLGFTADQQQALEEIVNARDLLLQKEQAIKEELERQLQVIRERIQAEAAQSDQADAEKRAANEALFAEIARRDALRTRTDLASQLASLARDEERVRNELAAQQITETQALERIATLRQRGLDLQRQALDTQIAAAEAEANENPTIENLRTLNTLLEQRNALEDQAASEDLRAQGEEQQARLREQAEAMAELVRQYQEYLAVAQRVVGHPLEGFFDDLLTGTKSAGEAFEDFARGVVRQFTRMVAQMLAQRAILAAVGLFFPGASVGAAAAQGFNDGGPVPGGGPDRDSVFAHLTPGEWVIPRRAVRSLGAGVMEQIRRGILPDRRGGPAPRSLPRIAYNTGGQVTGDGGGGSTRIVPAVVASEHQLEQLIAGGNPALLRHYRDNATEIKAALGLV